MRPTVSGASEWPPRGPAGDETERGGKKDPRLGKKDALEGQKPAKETSR